MPNEVRRQHRPGHPRLTAGGGGWTLRTAHPKPLITNKNEASQCLVGYQRGVVTWGGVAVAKRDMRWLEQRRQTWYAVLYVPTPVQPVLGKKLRKSLGTRDLMEAHRKRFGVLAEFRKQIEDAARGAPAGSAMDDLTATAIRLREDHERMKRGEPVPGSGWDEAEGPEAFHRDHITDWAEQAGKRHGAEAGSTLRRLALGEATPLMLHVPDWLHEGGVKGPFEPGTKVQHERTLAELVGWMKQAKLAPTVEAVDRRAAGRFVTECLARSGRQGKTIARIVSSCRSYWTYLLRKGIAPGDKNPWDNQAPHKGSLKGVSEDTERAFDEAEMRRLLAGPADAELGDLMRVAALSGMRIEEICLLKVRDCAEAVFNIRKSKTKAGIRKVPIHPALAAIVASRSKGKDPKAYLFHEAGPLKAGHKRSAAVSKRFGHYRQRDGVSVHEAAEGKRRSLVNFHSFRRWFITEATRAGQPLRLVEQLVGHQPQGMTMGVYFGGDLPEQLRACVEAVTLPSGPAGTAHEAPEKPAKAA